MWQRVANCHPLSLHFVLRSTSISRVWRSALHFRTSRPLDRCTEDSQGVERLLRWSPCENTYTAGCSRDECGRGYSNYDERISLARNKHIPYQRSLLSVGWPDQLSVTWYRRYRQWHWGLKRRCRLWYVVCTLLDTVPRSYSEPAFLRSCKWLSTKTIRLPQRTQTTRHVQTIWKDIFFL